MIITITGPRSVGKSTISKIVAKELKMRYISSDEIGENVLKKQGGLDSSIKSGAIKQIIKSNGYSLILKEYEKDNFVFDLSGGSITSTDFPEASKEVREVAKSKSFIVGLLPFKNKAESIEFLFNREKERKHFKEMGEKDLLAKVERNYEKFPPIFKDFCDILIYTENRSSLDLADSIIRSLKK